MTFELCTLTTSLWLTHSHPVNFRPDHKHLATSCYFLGIVTDSTDYEQRSEIFVFDVGVMELVVNVTILDNGLSEEDRRFFVQLLPVDGSVELMEERRRASVLIVDDDGKFNVMSETRRL